MASDGLPRSDTGPPSSGWSAACGRSQGAPGRLGRLVEMPSLARPRDDLLSLNAAARRLGVHYMTAYRHVRLGHLPAEQRNGRWWVRIPDLEAAMAPAPGEQKPSRRSPARWQSPRRRLASRLLAADLGGAWAIVEASLAGGARPAEIYVQLLGPALQAIGRGWEAGSVSVQAEHRATAVAVRVMGRMAPLFSRRGRRARGSVVLGGAPGDPHLLPVAMVADVARQHGFGVVELGANVPVASFAEAVQSATDLIAVGVSVSDTACAGAARQVISQARALRPGVALLAGGPAVPSAATATSLGADHWAPDAAVAARLLSQLAGEAEALGPVLTSALP